MPPLLLSGSRFLVAGAILVVALKLTGSFAHATRRHWTAALLTGVPLLAVGNGGVVWAQQHVASGVAALLIASVPLWIAVLDRRCSAAPHHGPSSASRLGSPGSRSWSTSGGRAASTWPAPRCP